MDTIESGESIHLSPNTTNPHFLHPQLQTYTSNYKNLSPIHLPINMPSTTFPKPTSTYNNRRFA
ncbi:MAG: hypothetical protein NWF04_00840 [Candidatus Bathyarchaeota archaeon]|nr:hypothetical protein [Candidatus Bathyarchaeota archaeon]